MQKDVSSSEDESENSASEATEQLIEPDKNTTKYECPQDFVSFCHMPCSSTLRDNLKSGQNELWLIKAPASFNPERFSGAKVPLSGLQTLKVPPAAPGGDQQVFSILASSRCSSELRLITSDQRTSDSAAFGPMFSGLLNVCEGHGDGSTTRVPQVIPAAPAPSIPPGLKQRFHPFGSKTPTLTYVAENEVDGAAYGPSSTTLRPLVVKRFIEETGQEGEEDNRKKRKKKKKEKKIKSEQVEELLVVKQEPLDEIQEERMAELPFQKTKKKKKKKDRERQEVEEGLEPSVEVKEEEVFVKCEPMDTFYGDTAEVSGKKKKKKKKKSQPEDD